MTPMGACTCVTLPIVQGAARRLCDLMKHSVHICMCYCVACMFVFVCNTHSRSAYIRSAILKHRLKLCV